MKRLFLLFAVACVCFVSCSDTLDAEDKQDPTDPTEQGGGNGDKEYTVKFKVDMRIPELTEEVKNAEGEFASFVKFYTDVITSRLAIPNGYTLTFKKDEEVVGEYKGTCGETEIALSNGTYRVTGESTGDFNTASFAFDESITIDKNTSVLTLNPSFNCWIFLFDRRGFSNAWWCDGEKSVYLNKTDDVFYVFNSSTIQKLPFVFGDLADCNNLHEQIEYQDSNIWHLGVTWQDADKNYPAKVGYVNSLIQIGYLYYCDKDLRVKSIGLIWTTK